VTSRGVIADVFYLSCVKPIEPPDAHYLSAAVGWIELGNPVEARAELTQVHPERWGHPDVLEVRWALSAAEENWEEGLEIARALVRDAPERATGWLHQAYALRRVAGGGLLQAWEALLPASQRFPKEAIIPYNLACYACQMRDLDRARHWWSRALLSGDPARLKKLALADPDLEPLWREIAGGAPPRRA
jgi:tetratricopeptide (TPR) repeat protein